MKKIIEKRWITLAFGLALNVVLPAANAALSLTFSNGVGHPAPGNAPCASTAWPAGAEFRWCAPSGRTVIDGSGENAMNGGETWSFNNAGVLTGVTNTPANLGVSSVPAGSSAPLPGTNPTLQQNTLLLEAGFSLLAPTQGSLAGNAYGAGTYVGGTPMARNNLPFVLFPVLEGQFNNAVVFKLGSASGGVRFFADISNVATLGNTTTFDFLLHASELIEASENSAGYAGFTVQWELQGTGSYVAPVPIPAAIWLLGSGLLGLTACATRRKNS